MKKQIAVILILATVFICTQCATAQNYTPIATHDFGVDSVTGLDKQLQVWQLTIDVKSNKIIVVYDIVLVSNNVVVSVLRTDSYVRDNTTLTTNFNALRTSSLGQGIAYLINQDIGKINSFETLVTDLLQK